MATKTRTDLAPVIWGPMSLFEDLEKLLGHDMFVFPGAMEKEFRVPAIDLKEEESRYVLTAELPGLTKEDVSIEVGDGVLEISASKESSKEESDEGYIRRERGSMHFERRMMLPEDVDSDAIEAKLNDGVLELVVPKVKVAEPAKKKVDIN